jgi:glycosyltransferase involved in cell wall biosynthesis
MISFAITTHNEGEYIQKLLDQLVPFCEKNGDEIVVLDDNSTDVFTQNVLYGYAEKEYIKLHTREFTGDFSEHKNYLNSLCSGEYIFQVDADEYFNETLLNYLHDLTGHNPEIDLFWIPRVNIVNGLTQDDIRNWGWQVNEKNWVMFPDYQGRLYKNNENIKWSRRVHERITGHKFEAPLPAEEEWSLIHIKDINRQREQNKLYDTLTQ